MKPDPAFVSENYEVIPDAMDALAFQLEGWKKHYPLKFELWWRMFEKTPWHQLQESTKEAYLHPRDI